MLELIHALSASAIIVGQAMTSPGVIETDYAVTEYTLDGPTVVIVREVEDRD